MGSRSTVFHRSCEDGYTIEKKQLTPEGCRPRAGALGFFRLVCVPIHGKRERERGGGVGVGACGGGGGALGGGIAGVDFVLVLSMFISYLHSNVSCFGRIGLLSHFILLSHILTRPGFMFL